MEEKNLIPVAADLSLEGLGISEVPSSYFPNQNTSYYTLS